MSNRATTKTARHTFCHLCTQPVRRCDRVVRLLFPEGHAVSDGVYRAERVPQAFPVAHVTCWYAR